MIFSPIPNLPLQQLMASQLSWRVTAEGTVKSTQIIPVKETMFGDYLEQVFVKHFDRTAIVDTETGQEYTYGEVLQISKSLGATLQKRGVKPHDLVVLCAMTGVKSCCYILALIFCQATMVATKHFFSAYELEGVLKNFRTLKLIIADNASETKLRLATNVEVLNLEENWDLTQAGDFQRPGTADPRSSVMLICLTAGSTGPSKPVCMSHHSTMASMTQCVTSFSRYLMTNPISHVSGNLSFLMSVAHGETIFIASENLKDDIERYLDACAKYKMETGLIMPVVLTNLATYGPTDKLASVRRMFTGGSTTPQPIIDRFRANHPNIKIENLFGSSEAGVVLRSVNQDALHRLAVTPNVEAKIVDLQTNEILGPNQNGMLCIKAPSVALGYYNNEKATREAFVDGWEVTGDLAYRDDVGCFVIVDRLWQMIKCMDSQVAPADLELILSRDDDVLKVIVAGVPHEKYGEAAAAFIVPRKSANLEELRYRLLKVLASKLTFYKHLHGGLYFVAGLPETDVGKFSRKDIIGKHLKKQIAYLD